MMRRKYFSGLAAVLLIALLVLVGACKNPDQENNPIDPPIIPPDKQVPRDPNIPEPFGGYNGGTILDIAIEGDGDIVVSTESTGMHLFTPYGVFKRTLSTGVFTGIATSNFGVLDTGRGVMAVTPDTGCLPTPAYDDAYVQGGVPHTSYGVAWFFGEPDPNNPDVCVPIAATSSFSSCNDIPHGITYHPVTAFAYQKVFAPDCIADSDCPWPLTDTIDLSPIGPGGAILAYNPLAPLPPMDNVWQGTVDFLVYWDFPYYDAMQYYATHPEIMLMPACVDHNLFVIWDLTTPNYMSSRDGMECDNIADIEFDTLGRLIIAIPNADSVAISEPVVFGQPIVIQQVLGGRQNGLGVLPGEFQGPRAVAIDPRNQNILVSDSGNGRVQVFDNDGNYIREFGGADTNFTPGALRVDNFGAIYVANVNPDRAAGDDLRIYNEYGTGIQFGTIEGYVKDKDTGLPIDNAVVRVMSTFNPLDVVTNRDGYFIFPSVAAGSHNVIAEKYGYYTGNTTTTVTGGFSTITEIYIKKQQTEPAGYGVVTGTVISSMYQQPVTGLTAEIEGTAISSQTNGNGEFTLAGVPTGDHTFRLSQNGVIWYEKYITVTNGVTLDLGVIYLPIY